MSFQEDSKKINGSGPQNLTAEQKQLLEAAIGRGSLYKRQGASTIGTMNNWLNDTVSRFVAEQQKLKTTDRASWLQTNDSLAHGIIKSGPVELVNTGITPNAKPMSQFLGKSRKWEMEFQRIDFSWFDIWGNSSKKFADAQKRLSFPGLQALMAFNWWLKGIGLSQVVFDSSPNRPLQLSLLPIDPSRLKTPSDLQFSTNKDVYDGLELNEMGEPVKAWIQIDTNKGTMRSNFQEITIRNEVTGYPNLLIVANVEHIAEYKQDSILAPIIKTLRDSNDAFDAAIVSLMVQNIWSIFIENKFGNPSQPGSTDWEDREWILEKGLLMEGNYGQTPHNLTPKAPGPHFEALMNQVDTRLGAAMGRGKENITKTFVSSFSASRANRENAAMYNDFDRRTINDCFNQPVKSWFVFEMISKGRYPDLSMNEFMSHLRDGTDYAITKTQWFAPKDRPIDPGKTAKANAEKLKTKQTTLADIWSSQGAYFVDKLREMAMIKQVIQEIEEEFGVTLSEEEIQQIVETEGQNA